jgi:GDP-L-fucose synthase
MNILVTGADGFIGSNIIQQLSGNQNFKFFKGGRKNLDLFSQKSIKEFIETNNIDSIIHCAVEGGKRTIKDSPDIVFKNLAMFENLIACSSNVKNFINIASGAEYDRKNSMSNSSVTDLGKSIPEDYYGFSKYLISKRILSINKNGFVNLRVFGCFGMGEANFRMVKFNMLNYINNKPMIIQADRYMDFIYIKDLVNVIQFYLNKSWDFYSPSFLRDMNMTYQRKTKLSDITTLINSLEPKKVPVIIEDNAFGNDYCGESHLNAFNLNIIGIENGIKEYYKKIKL